MNEFLAQFLVECRELVEQATADLLALEERPEDRERLDGAFRAFHTLKGAAGIVDFTEMGLALHAVEDVLSKVRSGAQSITAGLISDCLTSLDQVVQWLDAMQVSGEPPADARAASNAIIARFAASPAPDAQSAVAIDPLVGGTDSQLSSAAREILVAQLALLDDPAAEPAWGRTASAGRVALNLLQHADRTEEAGRLRQALARAESERDPRAVRAAVQGLLDGAAEAGGDAAPASPGAPEPALRGVRVDVERIDALVSLTGELTVAKTALAHAAMLARAGGDPEAMAVMLKGQHAVLERLVGDLQRAVLSIRVLPLRQVFQRFPRVVREMVVALGKPARLVTEGDATEADKAIVESLFEPLLHVMRNALDHGVETATARAAAGKPPSATIRLSASRHGDHVIVEVSDDGGGLDLARVREVAVARGIVSADVAVDLPDEALIELVFAPGFSTAAEVSSLSGRGVGMDAVRNAIERIGGRVTMESRAGEGTTVRFALPFTMMMSRVMTVEAGGQMFGVPMEAVVETVRVPRKTVTPVGAARAFVLRGRTIPLIDLGGVLGVARPERATAEAKVVIAVAGGQVAGLEVDRLGEPMEVMLKPMDGLLAGTPGVAGATLLGDGRVLIVLDLPTLLT